GLMGAVLAPVVRGVVREPFLLLGSLVAVVAAALWAGESFDLVRATVVAGVVGAATGAGRLAFDGLLQRDAPSSLRGRTFARYETIFQLCWVCGAGLATAVPFGPTAGMRTLAAIAAGGLLLAVRGLLHRRPAAR
ncbi:MAG: MFS transporter, partial [Actinomycetota bacterium]|nr:MFS transporter [Actinomycetota bacterium]